MKTVQEGNSIVVDYEGRIENGLVFENTADSEPLEFTLGNSEVLPGFEQTVLGMAEGETRTVKIPAADAFGPRHEELVQEFAKACFGAGSDLSPGALVALNIEKDGQAQKVPATVTAVNEDKVVVDFNHPLAGHALIYSITVRSIK